MWFGFLPFGGVFTLVVPILFALIVARIAGSIMRGATRRRLFDDNVMLPDDRVVRSRSDQDEARIFKLAYRLKGRVTVSDVVVETGLGVQDAESLIQSMVDQTHVRMEVDERGIVTYEFPEIIRRFEP